MAKAFATYEQQIKKLGKDGLLIEDAAYAEAKLRDIGYFTLVNGYKRLLRDPSTGKYRAGSSFSDLIALYEFDSSLRELFSHSLSYVERKMRSVVSYTFWGGIPGACLWQQLANETRFAVALQGLCIVKKRFSSVHRLMDVYNDGVVNDCVKTCTFWHNRPIASHPYPPYQAAASIKHTVSCIRRTLNAKHISIGPTQAHSRDRMIKPIRRMQRRLP